MKRRVAALVVGAAMLAAPAMAQSGADAMRVFKESCLDVKPDAAALTAAAKAKGYTLLKAGQLGDLGNPIRTYNLLQATGFQVATTGGTITVAIQTFVPADTTRKVACTMEWFGAANDSPGPKVTEQFGQPSSKGADSATWENVAGPWDQVMFSFNIVGGRFMLRSQAK